MQTICYQVTGYLKERIPHWRFSIAVCCWQVKHSKQAITILTFLSGSPGFLTQAKPLSLQMWPCHLFVYHASDCQLVKLFCPLGYLAPMPYRCFHWALIHRKEIFTPCSHFHMSIYMFLPQTSLSLTFLFFALQIPDHAPLQSEGIRTTK